LTSHPTPTSRRLLFYTLYLAYIAAGIISILPGPTLSLLAANTGVSLVEGGWIFTTSATGFAAGALLAGVLCRWISPKTVLLIGLALMGGSGLITPLTHSFPVLLVSQFTKGLGFGFLDVTINIITTLAFHETLSETFNRLHSSFGIGSLVAPLLLSATLTLLHNFAWAYLAGSIAMLSCAGLLIDQRIPTGAPWPAATAEQGEQRDRQIQTAKGGSTRSILWQLLLWLMALEFFLYIISEVGFSNWIVTAVSMSASISLALAAPVATAFWLGLTASRLLGAQALKRGLLREKQLLYLCIAGGGASGLLAALFPGQLLIAFVASALFGFFLGPLYPGLMAIATRRFVHVLNTISGVLLVSCGVSAMIFPALMGALIPAAGIRWAMTLPALGCLLIAVPLFLATRKQRLALQLQRQEHTIEETPPLSSIGQE
jgi:fucose permease